MNDLVGNNIGRYKIVKELGHGGITVVYQAIDTTMDRYVAIRVIQLGNEDKESSDKILQRFNRETKAMAGLSHPNIVQIFDFGIHNNLPYLVMDYIPGGTLMSRLGKPIHYDEAAAFLIPLTRALQYIHQKKIVHRDIRPGNILITDLGQPILTEFSVLKLLDIEEGQTITGTGKLVGTPAYMSPEQIRGEDVDGRTDIYSLGAVFFEMITGRIPYTGHNFIELSMKHLYDPIPKAKQLVNDLPIEVEKIIVNAMAKRREERFQTMDTFGSALEKISGAMVGTMPATRWSVQDTKQEDYYGVSDLDYDITAPSLEENVSDITEVEKTVRLQAAIASNLLANNRSQPVLNDRAQGEDQLGIKNEVEALAETLILRDVEPPVAVGVMGGWGSGKSFVMYLINQYVQATRAKQVKIGWANGDEKNPKIPAFVGHIYQVNFNAWTYTKSNLWASLMNTLFTTLNRQMQLERLLAYRRYSPTDEPPTKDQIRESLLAGGDEFKKIYLENIQIDQDKDLKDWRENLVYWSQHLLKETLLWNVMRGQQVKTLEQLKDTEEQLNQLKSRREQFEKDRSLKGVTSKSLDEKTARPAYIQSLKSFILAFLSEQLSNTANEELKKEDISEKDVQKYLTEATGLLGGAKTLFAAFRQSKLHLFWTIIFLVMTFTIPYLWKTYALEFIQLRVAQIISALIALAPTLATILPWIKKSIEAGVEAKKILEGAYTAQQAKYAEEIANATDTPLSNKISKLQTEIGNGSMAAYDALIDLIETRTEEQRQKIGPSAKYSNLMEFVHSRLDAATYENQLGLMHQVRQDIDELTFSLVDNANPDVFPRGKPRVILYIDDLDRCPPPRVVEILEAVQLLLNTKLFIVILGLDTRYVTRALEKEYKEILQHEGDPSGLDYIEKIIQIPYRVRSIKLNSLRNYLETQMEIEELPESLKPELAHQPAPSQSEIAKVSIESSTSVPLAEPVQLPINVKTDEPPAVTPELPIEAKVTEAKLEPKPESEPLEIDLPAAVIQFKGEDLDDLATCCQKIVLTPRSIKRLVNVFKLMKIFWFRADKTADIEKRDPPRSVKQASICLLALSSAYPNVMREVFVQLDALYRQGRVEIDLFTALNNIVLPPGSARELSWQHNKYKSDLAALKSITGNGQDNFGQLSLQALMLSTFNIVRSFSFVGDPVYWTDEDEESTPPKNEKKTRRLPKRKTNKKTEIK